LNIISILLYRHVSVCSNN